MENKFYPFVNLPLPYEYSSLEPFIDTKTMQLHHGRHLKTYVDNLNNILSENPKLQQLSLTQLIKNASHFPRELQAPVTNNAGGVYNHRFFFDLLINPSDGLPFGNLAHAIDMQFGGFKKFKSEFKKAALSVFGSGYAWLVTDKGKLGIVTTPNQNTPVTQGLCPVLVIDVWEHAYYLNHYNMRSHYIDDWFNVVNWEKCEQNYFLCNN